MEPPKSSLFRLSKGLGKFLHFLPVKREFLAYTLPLGTCCESLGRVKPSDLCGTLLMQF